MFISFRLTEIIINTLIGYSEFHYSHAQVVNVKFSDHSDLTTSTQY